MASNSGACLRSSQRFAQPFVREERQRREQHRERDREHQELRRRARRGCPRFARRRTARRRTRRPARARRRRAARRRSRCRVARAMPYISDRLHDEQAERRAEHRQRLRHEQRQVRAHADRHEEEAQQQALERLDVGFELVPELGVGEQHAREERAERHRQADRFHDQRRADHDQQRGGGEHLAAAVARDELERRPRDEAAADDRPPRSRRSPWRRASSRSRRGCPCRARAAAAARSAGSPPGPGTAGSRTSCVRAGAESCPRSPSHASTIAVDDIASPKPTTSAGCHASPNACAIDARARRRMSATCAPPRPNTEWRSAHRRDGSSSRPTRNRSSTTPSSATCSVLERLPG